MSSPPDLLSDTRGLRAPRQDRSRRTLDRIVAAARRLLADQGIASVTVQSVVVNAGASVGSFYARFWGKEDLLHFVHQEVWEDVRAWWDQALDRGEWQSLTLDGSVDRAVALLQESVDAFATERRALRGRPEGVSAEETFRRQIRHSLIERILLNYGAINHPEPGVAVDLGLRAVYGAILDLEADGEISTDELARRASQARQELTRLLLAYLSPPDAGGVPGAGNVDFFDVWG